MPYNLKNRSFLKLLDFSQRDMDYLLDLARDLKRAKYGGYEEPKLRGKNIALIFEKTSTRTRCAFEVAAYDQGANVTYLDPASSHIGHKESIRDTARVLGRMYDAIEYRGHSQAIVEELAEHAGVPVYNGLTDEWHPTQMAADLMTMREHKPGPWHEISYCYLGDARNNMGNSLMIAGCLMGMDVRIAAPRELWPDEKHVAFARDLEQASMGRLTLTESPEEGVDGVDFIHTDVWVSMGEKPETWAQPGGNGGLGQPPRQVHALPARFPRPEHGGRAGNAREVRPGRDGGHRRGVRITGRYPVRTGGKPGAFHQGAPGRDVGRLDAAPHRHRPRWQRHPAQGTGAERGKPA